MRPHSPAMPARRKAARRVTLRPAPGRTIPAGISAHSSCYTCHTPESKIGSCNTCHTIEPYSRTVASRATFAAFRHSDHTARVSCAECHNIRPGAPQGRQVTSPVAVQHFASAEDGQLPHLSQRPPRIRRGRFRQLQALPYGVGIRYAAVTPHDSPKSKVQSPKSKVQGPRSEVEKVVTELAEFTELGELEEEERTTPSAEAAATSFSKEGSFGLQKTLTFCPK